MAISGCTSRNPLREKECSLKAKVAFSTLKAKNSPC